MRITAMNEAHVEYLLTNPQCGLAIGAEIVEVLEVLDEEAAE